MKEIRVMPASPSYFTGVPRYTDDVLALAALLRKHQLLPRVPPSEASKVAWKKLSEYRIELAEPVAVKGYGILLSLLKRLNCIHPSVIPDEVVQALNKYKRQVQPHENQAKPILIDSWGRAKAIGRRKSSSAMVYVVEGQGECFINGRTISDYFGRVHDRESAVWALKATQRLDKYNVWAKVEGGGTTGQAEAITLGVARALLAHEPALKPALRKGEICLSFRECIETNTNDSQLVVSRAIPEEWRERSPASSRQEKCLPGSSVSIFMLWSFFHCTATMYISDCATTFNVQASALSLPNLANSTYVCHQQCFIIMLSRACMLLVG
jgi:small subunit ribosomal protein S9